MKSVKIAEFKSKLSAYIRLIRKGFELVVTDRETPVARVIPFEEPDEEAVISEPIVKSSLLNRLSYPRSKKKINTLAILREERKR